MNINKDELYKYYIMEKHSVKETLYHFNIKSEGVFYRLLNKLGIKKNTGLKNIKLNITKENILDYLKSNSVKETINYFNISSTYFYQLCKDYNINLSNTSYIEAKDKISKNTLYNYYIVENHTLMETKNYFKVSRNTIVSLLKSYNIVKESHLNNLKSIIDYDSLYNYYIIKNNSIKKTAEYFNTNCNNILKLLNTYNINKININKNNILDLNGNLISNQDIYNYYISNNHSREDTLNHFKISVHKFKKVLSLYDIVKIKHTKKPELFNQVLNRINKDDLYDYYIDKNNSIEDTLNHFNITQPILVRLMKHYDIKFKSNFSHYEADIEKYFPDIEFEKNIRLLNGKEIDLYVPDLNIGIEFNGNYWHSSIYKTKNYHFEKSKLASKLGIRLIHIWEYEWENPITREKIISLLSIALGKVTSKIYARNCEIKQITNTEAKYFNDLNHLQGHRNAQVTYGLFYNDKLVQLMSFSKTKYNKNLKSSNSWEIIRGCPGSNNIVVGGVSKLFKHFIRNYNPDSIFSYCDFNKFDGKGYEALGMEFIGYTGPDMKWLMKNNIVVNRQPKKHKELKENSLAQIFGAGSKKYIWKSSK